jgi:hypothetical protein
MDSRQAREILALYRPGSIDAADPKMAEALDQVKRDPELAAWFEEHCAVYTAIRGKLKAIPVPPGLKRTIIVEHAEHAPVIPLPGAAKILLAAAAIVLLTAIVWFGFNIAPNQTATFARYRDRMARSVQRSTAGYMKMRATNQVDIREYFRASNRPADFPLPKNLQQLPGEGGSVLTWNNHPVEMLCLNAGPDAAGHTNDLWLFVMNKSAVPDAPASGPQFQQVARLMTVSWSVGDNVYLLAGRGDADELKKYLQ